MMLYNHLIQRYQPRFNAEVAELVDALGSGSSGRTPVRVRVSPSAPFSWRNLNRLRLFIDKYIDFIYLEHDLRGVGSKACLSFLLIMRNIAGLLNMRNFLSFWGMRNFLLFGPGS
jgi:hypothetical protein